MSYHAGRRHPHDHLEGRLRRQQCAEVSAAHYATFSQPRKADLRALFAAAVANTAAMPTEEPFTEKAP